MRREAFVLSMVALSSACSGAAAGPGPSATQAVRAPAEQADLELERASFSEALAVALPGMARLAPGVLGRDLEVGRGAIAMPGREVHLTYVAYLTDGRVVDRSVPADGPLRFTIGGGKVIRGWDFGVRGMRSGGTRQLVVASRQAYGRRGVGGIPPSAVMVFVVRLEEVR